MALSEGGKPYHLNNRFDRLVDMIYLQFIENADVLLDRTDVVVLINGVNRLREKQTRDGKTEMLHREIKRGREIARRIAKEHGFQLQSICGARRNHEVVKAKHAAIRAVHAQCPLLEFSDIALMFGLHHSSVLHALGRKKNRIPPKVLPVVPRIPPFIEEEAA